MQTWKAAEQGGEGDLAFQSGQRRTEAEVRSHSESNVLVGFAGNVECFGIGELRLIVVCRSQTHADKLTARNRDQPDRDVLESEPRRCKLHRTGIPQNLFDSGYTELRGLLLELSSPS